MAEVLRTKRVIQNKDTKLFLKPNGKWTKRFDDARHFRCFAEVVSTCEAKALKSVELVLKFQKSEYDQRFNLSL
jgi:hypothetical protein